jgi:hypothetical protein
MNPYFWKYSKKIGNIIVQGDSTGKNVQLTVPWSRWSIKLDDFCDMFTKLQEV